MSLADHLSDYSALSIIASVGNESLVRYLHRWPIGKVSNPQMRNGVIDLHEGKPGLFSDTHVRYGIGRKRPETETVHALGSAKGLGGLKT